MRYKYEFLVLARGGTLGLSKDGSEFPAGSAPVCTELKQHLLLVLQQVRNEAVLGLPVAELYEVQVVSAEGIVDDQWAEQFGHFLLTGLQQFHRVGVIGLGLVFVFLHEPYDRNESEDGGVAEQSITQLLVRLLQTPLLGFIRAFHNILYDFVQN